MVEILPFSTFEKVYLFEADRTQKQSFSLERLEKILIRSCEQSHTIWKPELIHIQNQEDLWKMVRQLIPVVLDCNQSDHNYTNYENSEAFLIGPEGGWSTDEKKLFEKFNLPIRNLGGLIYPSWLTCLYV
jgi:RsmE family RNA methyltransferase